MTNRTMLICAVALSLAVLSMAVVPASHAVHRDTQSAVTQFSPMHSLTGISFHSVAPGY
ncbi:MAG: hypothetical protein ACREFW_04965 [Rhizomicrobium sp.]